MNIHIFLHFKMSKSKQLAVRNCSAPVMLSMESKSLLKHWETERESMCLSKRVTAHDRGWGKGGWLSNLDAICLLAASSLQHLAVSCYFPWQACCLLCGRWFSSHSRADQHSILGADRVNQKSGLTLNHSLQAEGWSSPWARVPSGFKSVRK